MRGTPRPGATLTVLAAGTLPVALLQALVSPALPELSQRLGSSPTATTWLLTAYLLSLGVCTPIVGRLGDIYGKRRVLLIVLVVVGLGTAAGAMVTSLVPMILARVVQGVGGGLFPLGFGIVREQFPIQRVAGAVGLLSAVLGFGAGIGVAMSGLTIDNLNYHFLYWIPLVALLVALAGTAWVLPESSERSPGHVNWSAAALLSAGLTAVLVAVTETSSWGWGSPRTLGLVLGGVLVLVTWVRVEARASQPLVDMQMMRIRAVWSANLVAALVNVGLFTAFVLIPQFALTKPAAGFGFGATATEAGLLLVPLSVLMFVMGAAAGRIEQQIDLRIQLISGCGISAAAYAVLLTAHASPAPVYVATGVLGIGMGLSYAGATNVIVHAVRSDQTGVATGMVTVARTVGGTFAAQLAATLVAGSVTAAGIPTVRGYDNAFLVAVVALIAAAGVGCAIPRPDHAPTARSG